jgi:hypothetical protein
MKTLLSDADRRSVEFPPHPALGAMLRRAWGVLGYEHCDHHLKQFGV